MSKIKIRKGMFETNSSSTHAICIDSGWDNYKDLSKSYLFSTGEFGWAAKKCNVGDYLYTLAKDFDEIDQFIEITSDYLKRIGITAEYGDRNSWSYVDHCYEASKFYKWALESPANLYCCLFGNSFVQTGNDNCDSSKDVRETFNKWDGHKWFKGN